MPLLFHAQHGIAVRSSRRQPNPAHPGLRSKPMAATVQKPSTSLMQQQEPDCATKAVREAPVGKQLAQAEEPIELDASSGSGDESEAAVSSSSDEGPAEAPKPKATKRKPGSRAKAAVEAEAHVQHFDPQELQQARAALLAWYDAEHRVLPWRRTPRSTRTTPAPAGPHEAAEPAPADLDPQRFAYYVWVSEIMLQQTQVATVIPYFQKWISRWPSVSDLAAADVEQVNTMWAGLGYYRRARYLLDGAQHVMTKLGGQFPTTAKGMLSIPGVGPYTSAAVASIAFGDPTAVVDGNVIRVVSRLKSLAGDPAGHTATHTAIAQQLLDTTRPGDFNQAVMELGARVCRPVSPDCHTCPLASICTAQKTWQAYVAGGGCPDVEDAPHVTNYPGKKAVKAKKEQLVAVCVLEVVQSNRHNHHKQNAGTGGGGGSTGGGKTPAAKTTGGAGGGGSAGKVAGGGNSSAKRQATMFDFMAMSKVSKVGSAAGADVSSARDAAGRQQQGQGQQGQEEGQGEGQELTPAEVSALLSDAGRRHVMLVQRPSDGLLGGLWEFPSVIMSEETAASQRRSLINDKLHELLGPSIVIPGITPPPRDKQAAAAAAATTAAENPQCVKAQVIRRHDAGTYVHVFSHIKQTNWVERLVLVTDNLDAFIAASSNTPPPPPPPPPSTGQAAATTSTTRTKRGGGKTKGSGSGTGGGADGELGGGQQPSSSGAATKWIRASEVKSEGLSTGPAKMYAQATGSGAAGGQVKGGKPGKGKSQTNKKP